MSNPIFDLTGRTALVTGASSGFGARFARCLAEHGAAVVVAARREDRLQALVEEIQAGGGTALAVAMDVTDGDSVEAGFDQAWDALGPVTVVSNNAGVADARAALKIDEASWDRVLDTNLKGAWRVATAAGRRLVSGGHPGSIVNTASILGLRAAFGQSSYSASKAAVIHLTRSLALEWSRYKIRVNALAPGFFMTEINEGFLDSEQGRAYLQSTPAGRPGNMDEIVAPFLLLASEAGSFINGSVLTVDGGHHIANM